MDKQVNIQVNISTRFVKGLCLGAGLDFKELKEEVTSQITNKLRWLHKDFDYRDGVVVVYKVKWWTEILADDNWPSAEPMKITVDLWKDWASTTASRTRISPWVQKQRIIEEVEQVWEACLEVP